MFLSNQIEAKSSPEKEAYPVVFYFAFIWTYVNVIYIDVEEIYIQCMLIFLFRESIRLSSMA